MRYEIYDDDGILFRRFWSKDDAQRFVQPGWRLVVLKKPKKTIPTVEVFGEARW